MSLSLSNSIDNSNQQINSKINREKSSSNSSIVSYREYIQDVSNQQQLGAKLRSMNTGVQMNPKIIDNQEVNSPDISHSVIRVINDRQEEDFECIRGRKQSKVKYQGNYIYREQSLDSERMKRKIESHHSDRVDSIFNDNTSYEAIRELKDKNLSNLRPQHFLLFREFSYLMKNVQSGKFRDSIFHCLFNLVTEIIFVGVFFIFTHLLLIRTVLQQKVDQVYENSAIYEMFEIFSILIFSIAIILNLESFYLLYQKKILERKPKVFRMILVREIFSICLYILIFLITNQYFRFSACVAIIATRYQRLKRILTDLVILGFSFFKLDFFFLLLFKNVFFYSYVLNLLVSLSLILDDDGTNVVWNQFSSYFYNQLLELIRERIDQSYETLTEARLLSNLTILSLYLFLLYNIYDFINPNECQKKQADVIRQLQKKHVQVAKQYQILREIQENYRYKNEKLFDENFFKGIISQQTYQSLNHEIKHRSLLFEHEFFKDFTKEFKKTLIEITQIQYVQKGQEIQIEKNRRSLIYLDKGKFRQKIQQSQNQNLDNDDQRIYFPIKSKSLCNIENFLIGSPVGEKIEVSSNLGIIFSIDYQEFFKNVKKSPYDHQLFCMMKDKYMMRQREKWKKCCGCGKSGHFFRDCDLINYQPDRDQLIQICNTTQDQKRSAIGRKLRCYQNAYSDSFYIRMSARQLKLKMIQIAQPGMKRVIQKQYEILMENEDDKDFALQTGVVMISNDQRSGQKFLSFQATEGSEFTMGSKYSNQMSLQQGNSKQESSHKSTDFEYNQEPELDPSSEMNQDITNSIQNHNPNDSDQDADAVNPNCHIPSLLSSIHYQVPESEKFNEANNARQKRGSFHQTQDGIHSAQITNNLMSQASVSPITQFAMMKQNPSKLELGGGSSSLTAAALSQTGGDKRAQQSSLINSRSPIQVKHFNIPSSESQPHNPNHNQIQNQRKNSLVAERKSHSSQDALEVEAALKIEDVSNEDILERLKEFSSNLGDIIEKDIKENKTVRKRSITSQQHTKPVSLYHLSREFNKKQKLRDRDKLHQDPNGQSRPRSVSQQQGETKQSNNSLYSSNSQIENSKLSVIHQTGQKDSSGDNSNSLSVIHEVSPVPPLKKKLSLIQKLGKKYSKDYYMFKIQQLNEENEFNFSIDQYQVFNGYFPENNIENILKSQRTAKNNSNLKK